jgi:hypothetical protein
VREQREGGEDEDGGGVGSPSANKGHGGWVGSSDFTKQSWAEEEGEGGVQPEREGGREAEPGGGAAAAPGVGGSDAGGEPDAGGAALEPLPHGAGRAAPGRPWSHSAAPARALLYVMRVLERVQPGARAPACALDGAAGLRVRVAGGWATVLRVDACVPEEDEASPAGDAEWLQGDSSESESESGRATLQGGAAAGEPTVEPEEDATAAAAAGADGAPTREAKGHVFGDGDGGGGGDGDGGGGGGGGGERAAEGCRPWGALPRRRRGRGAVLARHVTLSDVQGAAPGALAVGARAQLRFALCVLARYHLGRGAHGDDGSASADLTAGARVTLLAEARAPTAALPAEAAQRVAAALEELARTSEEPRLLAYACAAAGGRSALPRPAQLGVFCLRARAWRSAVSLCATSLGAPREDGADGSLGVSVQ